MNIITNSLSNPMPQSERIWSYREWCHRFLQLDNLTIEEAQAHWVKFVCAWIGGVN
jgi:hypothetical protein